MKMNALAALAVGLLCVQAAEAEIIISEIFYNLNGSEGGAQEWVEITNTGSSTVDLSGWIYGDDQDSSYSDPFPSGTSLAAGASAVIAAQSESVFQSIWGAGIQVITYTVGGGNPGAISLANTGSAVNETPAIFDASNTLIDAVNYETGTNGWPLGAAANGASIYLLPNGFTSAANDIGANWAGSVAGVDGAYAALIVNPEISNATVPDVASPGTAVYVPEPASALLAMLSLVGLASRRK